ncbi:hypothetical protein CTEN210_11833 [Chaetoceros tenuissimus]|uniref:Circumsporozoite protein n=1 Tax=Chaetoceros tenuissimus TaxID=426638 RepID=A0AAD3D0H0_9STRA|nr:hypothetical protein CTEN210_11833 [Chaetoceros tenuissimus]
MLLLKRIGFIFLTAALASVSASEEVGTQAVLNKGLQEDSSDNGGIEDHTNSIIVETDGKVVTFNVVGKVEDNSIQTDHALKGTKKPNCFNWKGMDKKPKGTVASEEKESYAFMRLTMKGSCDCAFIQGFFEKSLCSEFNIEECSPDTSTCASNGLTEVLLQVFDVTKVHLLKHMKKNKKELSKLWKRSLAMTEKTVFIEEIFSTMVPSNVPSPSPSLSSKPSIEPSNRPSVSSQPSKEPSNEPSISSQPSKEPSNKPSVSSQPSKEPSDKPSVSSQPSKEPSNEPSVSSQPSIEPSNEPSKAPNCSLFRKRGSSSNDMENWLDEDDQSLATFCSIEGCCTGDNACAKDWSSNASYIICSEACKGESSCRGIGANSAVGSVLKISAKSCSHNGSCKNIGHWSTEVLNLFVGRNSCSSWRSCNYIAYDSEVLSSVHIGDSSCVEYEACHFTPHNSDALVTFHIGDSSCVKKESCINIAFNSKALSTFYIGDSSCVEDNSCYAIAFNSKALSTFHIGDSSCFSEDSCYEAVREAEDITSLSVQNDECSSFRACSFCGGNSNHNGGFQLTESCCSSPNDVNCEI